MPVREQLDAITLQNAVRMDCTNAVDWLESEISSSRQVAEAYYQGRTRVKSEEGRSRIIITAVRDAIRGILPSIGRIFTQTDTICEFSSDDEVDEKICEEMTLFANGIYHKHGGYKTLIEGTTDALTSKIGVAYVNLQRREIASYQQTQTMGGEELRLLDDEVQAGKVTITESKPTGYQDTEGEEIQQVNMIRKSFRNKWTIECLPPEVFIADAKAIDKDKARIIGIRKMMPIYEAMEMGLDYDTLITFPSGSDASLLQDEKFNRLGYDDTSYEAYTADESNRPILVTEVWYRIDTDGDGIAELHHMILCGPNYQIMEDTLVNCVPLAIFRVDLQPHVMFGTALAEDLMQDQDTQTVLLRSMLDNAVLTNSPRTVLNEELINLDDAKSNEIGNIIRAKNIDAIKELTTPFVAGETLPILEYARQVAESRSGVTKLSQGVDPNALQATSRIAANAAVTGADARIEMMARNIAETGVKELFHTIIRVAMYELKGPQSIKTPTGYKEINPGIWHDQINIVANVGMGNGKIEEKQAVLTQVLQGQMQLYQALGPTNPYVTMDSIRNTYKAMLRLSGYRNSTEFFPLVDQQTAQAWQMQQEQKAQQAAQQQQPQASPQPDLVGAAKVKAESDLQIAQAKIQSQQQADVLTLKTKSQIDLVKMMKEIETEIYLRQLEVDRQRDADNQKYAVDAFKIGLDGTTQQMVMQQNMMNNPTGPPQKKANGQMPQ